MGQIDLDLPKENINIEESKKNHFDSIVVDTHNDTMSRVVDQETGLPKINIGEDTDFQIDIPKAQKGGLKAAFFAAFTDYEGSNELSNIKSNSKTLALINALYWTVENNPEAITIVKSVNEIKNAKLNKKIAAVPTIEGAYALEKRNAIELLNQYYDLGIRAIAYVWNSPNNLGSGADGPIDMGLTELGYEVTKEMNRLGIIIDVSHMNQKTFWDVIKVSKAPIIASHSCAYSLKNHVRNLTDEQIKALSDIKGVVNLNYWCDLLGDREKEVISIKNIVDHIDYIVNLVGIDYVGLGSDFDGTTTPNDIQSAVDLPKITLELTKRGYSKSDIQKILGLNNLRVMEEAQKIARQHSSNADNKVTITPWIKMGNIIEDKKPLITAKIATNKDFNINELSFRVIINGIVYDPKFNEESGIVSLQIEEAFLRGTFHVVTFECRNVLGKVNRETVIFYIQ